MENANIAAVVSLIQMRSLCGGLKNTFKNPNRCQSFHEEKWVMGAYLLQDDAGGRVRLSLGSQSVLQRGSISSWNSCQTANGCFSLGHCALLILLFCVWTQSDLSIWCTLPHTQDVLWGITVPQSVLAVFCCLFCCFKAVVSLKSLVLPNNSLLSYLAFENKSQEFTMCRLLNSFTVTSGLSSSRKGISTW